MVVPELEKLAENERAEFVRLSYKRPFQMNASQKKRWEYFTSKANPNVYLSQLRQEEASQPREWLCTLESRDPYFINTPYGNLKVPEKLVPSELRNPQSSKYFEDTFFAEGTANLQNNLVTSLRFKTYLEKMSKKELAKFWKDMKVLKPNRNWDSV